MGGGEAGSVPRGTGMGWPASLLSPASHQPLAVLVGAGPGYRPSSSLPTIPVGLAPCGVTILQARGGRWDLEGFLRPFLGPFQKTHLTLGVREAPSPVFGGTREERLITSGRVVTSRGQGSQRILSRGGLAAKDGGSGDEDGGQSTPGLMS